MCTLLLCVVHTHTQTHRFLSGTVSRYATLCDVHRHLVFITKIIFIAFNWHWPRVLLIPPEPKSEHLIFNQSFCVRVCCQSHRMHCNRSTSGYKRNTILFICERNPIKRLNESNNTNFTWKHFLSWKSIFRLEIFSHFNYFNSWAQTYLISLEQNSTKFTFFLSLLFAHSLILSCFFF